VLGDPTKASKEAGELAIEAITDHMVDVIRKELED
jgi:creatinine amidohydrolase/Fe(II)-dependent formamide hydrolase-like protein